MYGRLFNEMQYGNRIRKAQGTKAKVLLSRKRLLSLAQLDSSSNRTLDYCRTKNFRSAVCTSTQLAHTGLNAVPMADMQETGIFDGILVRNFVHPFLR